MVYFQRISVRGIRHKRNVLVVNIIRPKISTKELLNMLQSYIANGIIALCNGLRSYHGFLRITDCIVRECNEREAGDPVFTI